MHTSTFIELKLNKDHNVTIQFLIAISKGISIIALPFQFSDAKYDALTITTKQFCNRSSNLHGKKWIHTFSFNTKKEAKRRTLNCDGILKPKLPGKSKMNGKVTGLTGR